MDITLPSDLRQRFEQEIASGRYQDSNQLILEAVRYFLDDCERGQRRLDVLRRIGQAVEQAGLYEEVFVPRQE